MTGANHPTTRAARRLRLLGRATVGCVVVAALVVLLRHGTPNPLVDERFEQPPPEAERLRDLAERVVREYAAPGGEIARSPSRDIEREGTDGQGVERWTVYGRVDGGPWRAARMERGAPSESSSGESSGGSSRDRRPSLDRAGGARFAGGVPRARRSPSASVLWAGCEGPRQRTEQEYRQGRACPKLVGR